MLAWVKLEVLSGEECLSGPTRTGSLPSKPGRRETPKLWKEPEVSGLLGWASLFGLTYDIDAEG